MDYRNEFVIIRDDLLTDPVTIITQGLLIGRLQECQVFLNHSSVSRAHAGIKQIDDNYYLFPLRPSNPVTLNGKKVEDNEALASGDILGIGPFQLEIEEADESLVIRVSLLIGSAAAVDVSNPKLTTNKLVEPVEGSKKPAKRASPIAGTKALDIFWDKRIREAGKMMRPSPLLPRTQRRSGKAQFNWIGTSDLQSRWPLSIFIWAFIGVGVLAVVAAYTYVSAYTPAPLAKSHTATVMTTTPAIATKPNAGACLTCHSWNRNIEAGCTECHQTSAFVSTVTKPHEAAGVGCIDCHAEHRGADFRAGEEGLASCSTCHNDANRRVFRGKRVGTPHGGTVGYPVVNGVWSLKAVDDDAWTLKKMAIVRLPDDTDQKWKSKQFHALHSERVRVVPGIEGNALGQLSCSSCHKSFDPIDRATPRTTCGTCHNGLVESGTKWVLIASDKPNCTSCHVQHIKDVRQWGTRFLTPTTSQPAGL